MEVHSFVVNLGGYDVTVNVSVDMNTFKALVDFSYKGDPYTFMLKDVLFHIPTCGRETDLGFRMEDGQHRGNYVQKLNCVLQGAQDMMKTLSLIFAKYPHSTLSYAAYYLKHVHGDPLNPTYKQFITYVTCKNIAMNGFIDFYPQWELVEFSN